MDRKTSREATLIADKLNRRLKTPKRIRTDITN